MLDIYPKLYFYSKLSSSELWARLDPMNYPGEMGISATYAISDL